MAQEIDYIWPLSENSQVPPTREQAAKHQTIIVQIVTDGTTTGDLVLTHNWNIPEELQGLFPMPAFVPIDSSFYVSTPFYEEGDANTTTITIPNAAVGLFQVYLSRPWSALL